LDSENDKVTYSPPWEGRNLIIKGRKCVCFVWQYSSLNSGPCACRAGTLPLAPTHPPFLHWLFLR
jgi:hypothetical protein